jgi:hypothetical protein
LVDTSYGGDESERGLTSGRSGTSGDFEMIDAESVAMSSRLLGSPAQRYKLMCLPHDEESLDLLCSGLIGQGPTFCIRKYCQIVHQGGKVSINPGDVHVVKQSNTAVFLEPSAPGNLLAEDLFIKWMDERVTLDEWSHSLTVVRSSGTPVTME